MLLEILVLMSVVTFLLRAAPLTFLARVQFPDLIKRSLEFIPVSILSVMLVSEIFVREGRLRVIFDSKVIAAFVTFLVAYYSRNSILTVIVGIISCALLKLALGF